LHDIAYHDVPRETFEATEQIIGVKKERLDLYVDQLFWWNQKINLISRDVSRETIWEHIRHSLLLGQFRVFKQYEFIVDTGSGGGLPGIPLAIAYPRKKMVLNDIVSKKIMAVKQIVRKLSLSNAATSDSPIQDIKLDADEFFLVSKHAFKINQLYKYTAHLPWSAIALYKSIQIDNELEGLGIPLDITVYNLYPNSGQDFYKGKGIIIIRRLN